MIDLKVYSSVKSSDRTTKNDSFDLYSNTHSFSLIATSESEKEDWIRALGRAIVISHNAQINDQIEDEDYEDESDNDY